MRSMRIDCAPVRIGSWEELEAYMDGSAGSVGRIMAPLLGVPARHHAGYGRLGQAFQLANFIRDVREDTALDRIYLPAEDRAAYGVGEPDLARGTASPELRALLAMEVRRARGLFAEAEPAVAAAPASVRTGVRFAVAVYLRVLDRVERIEFDVLGRGTGVRPGSCPAPRSARCGDDAPGHAARRRADAVRGERADVLICGASFAGLAVARELAGAGADVLVVDRYEIGERQTSACAAPTPWLHAMGVAARDPPGDPVHGLPHAARLGPLPAAVELVVVRLPDAVRGALGAVRRRALRGRQGRADDVAESGDGAARRRTAAPCGATVSPIAARSHR